MCACLDLVIRMEACWSREPPNTWGFGHMVHDVGTPWLDRCRRRSPRSEASLYVNSRGCEVVCRLGVRVLESSYITDSLGAFSRLRPAAARLI